MRALLRLPRIGGATHASGLGRPGNLEELLFINFEKPHRLRLQGIAGIDDNDPLLQEYFEAQLVIRVTVSEIFRNSPRYVHRYKKIQTSEFVPRSTRETPFARWKRVDDIQTALSAKDRASC